MVFLSNNLQRLRDEDRTKEDLIDELRALRKELYAGGKPSSMEDQKSARLESVAEVSSLFETVINNVPMVAIQGFDSSGRVRHWNEASVKLYGYTSKQAVGNYMQELIIGADQIEDFEQELKYIEETRKPTSCKTWELVTKDGRTVWTYSGMFPVLAGGKIDEIFCMDIDITERVRIEELLRESGEQLRTLINAMPDIVCFKDGDGRWLEANPFDLRLFDIEDVPYRGKTDAELAEYSSFYREAFLSCEESDEVAWQSGTARHAEEAISKPDGTVLTFDVIKVPLFFPDGRRKGLVVIGRDITDRKRAEDELKEAYLGLEKKVHERTAELAQARNTLEAILNTVPIGVIMAEANPEHITYYSPNAIKVLGGGIGSRYPEQPVPPCVYLQPDGSRFDDGQLPLHRSLLYGDSVKNLETIVVRSDGSRVITLISSAPVRDSSGGITAAVASLVDVTELRRADNALKESERFLTSVFNGIQDGISVLDRDLNILRVNPTMEKLYPLVSSLAGKKCFEAYHGRSEPCARCPTIRAMESRSFESEIVPIVKAGEICGWLELSAFPLINDKGAITGVIENVRDITGRKKAEADLKEAMEQAELYLDLMGHDIRNKNQITLGFIELARGLIEIDGKLGKDNINLLDKALESLQDSSALIDNVKKLQKVKYGRKPLKAISPAEALEGACRQFTGLKNVKIHADIPRKCDYQVAADELLVEVFTNILGNAIKHSGGKETVEIGVSMALVCEGGRPYCRISIEDNGPGIEDSSKQNIFHRIQKGTTRVVGKGLGLYLVKSLVEYYRGKVRVEDRIPWDHTLGCRFVILLPVIRAGY